MVLKPNGTIGIPFADYSGFPSYSKAEDVAATFLTLISNIQALIFLFFLYTWLAVWAMAQKSSNSFFACSLGHAPSGSSG
jgi:hypothetical protein